MRLVLTEREPCVDVLTDDPSVVFVCASLFMAVLSVVLCCARDAIQRVYKCVF